MTPCVLRSLNDWVVKLLLMPVEGITDVLSFGGDVLQYQVQINPSQLLAYELSLNEVVEAIEANNRNAGGWYLDRGAEQLVVRGGGEGLRDIGNIPVKEVDGVAVRVRDLAKVDFGPEIRQGAVTLTERDSNGSTVRWRGSDRDCAQTPGGQYQEYDRCRQRPLAHYPAGTARRCHPRTDL